MVHGQCSSLSLALSSSPTNKNSIFSNKLLGLRQPIRIQFVLRNHQVFLVEALPHQGCEPGGRTPKGHVSFIHGSVVHMAEMKINNIKTYQGHMISFKIY